MFPQDTNFYNWYLLKKNIIGFNFYVDWNGYRYFIKRNRGKL